MVTELAAVSCPSRRNCTAVGQYWDGAAYHTLAEHWDGTAWVIQPTPDPPSATVTFLNAVACPVKTMCEAAGYHQNNAGHYATLAERWDGATWAIQPTPDPAGVTIGMLDGIACPAPSTCTAVGLSADGSISGFTLAEHWDGTTWAIQPTPNPGGTTYAELDSIACPSASTCTAAGSASGHGPSTTLAEHWDGTTWAIQPTPSPGPAGSTFHGVACPSRRICLAVGGDSAAVGQQATLAERWNGNTWTLQPAPSPAASPVSELDAVACTSAKLCTAAGSSYATTGIASTLAERLARHKRNGHPGAR